MSGDKTVYSEGCTNVRFFDFLFIHVRERHILGLAHPPGPPPSGGPCVLIVCSVVALE